MDYRCLPEAHRPVFRRLVRYAFSPERGPDPDDDEEIERPDIYRRRGLYDVDAAVPDEELDGDDLLAVCGYYAFTARVRGGWHPLGGVSAVASPPETRRQGHVGRLLSSLLREFCDRGTYFSALWPFEYGFYRRFGYAMANTHARTVVPPAELAEACGDAGGRFRSLDADEHPRLDDVHREWATEALAIRRTEGWWRHRAFSWWRTDPYAYGWEDDDGDLRGYLFYTVEEEDDEKIMNVGEFAAADAETRRQLLRFCRDHDSQVDAVRLHGPAAEATSLPEALSDPRAASVEIEPGPMVRIVDVEAAAAALAYPDGVAGSVTVEVTDDRCPWNDGAFELVVDGGEAACRPTDADPAVRLNVRALSKLVVGSKSLAALARRGEATVEDETAAKTLAAAFPPEPVYLREGF
ncbi:GNAT family N-acetyltransferase [Halegenticoccus tardaugens]|uniref:GNAT family N-acetyltransferase n=1 Tax=Halegenticoccus tardaugens TaxID=2071624 RepID=UPI00100AF4A1|nr:GNAT family N-acetyltransferase [Halegenticoccus tardaugens]